MPPQILLLDPDPTTRDTLASALGPNRPFLSVSTTTEAEQILDTYPIKVLLCADNIGDESGLMFLARTKNRWPLLRRILMAPNLDADLFFYAMREVSLFDYISKPISERELTATVIRAIAQFDALQRLGQNEKPEEIPSHLPKLDEPDTPKPPNRIRDGAFFISGLLVGSASTLLILVVFYLVKSALGGDIFPLIHLQDLME